ncbi:uncharacterized protein SAPINGB_P000181 [Magnusiomyces paraingens]|uniref:Uncharacterized protein n=1 Tax=Magnusiomyces paraingens TaxID=2606893 RepID=A0A5E8AYM9_9ASCO|nr:uncharacterized protein SAPINGB_P000181 [Saprochaete ingens]VVT43858.1 unnamed protein product [Saprochaete ingens]
MSVAPPRTAPAKKPPAFVLSSPESGPSNSPSPTFDPTTTPALTAATAAAAAAAAAVTAATNATSCSSSSSSSYSSTVPLEKSQSYVNLTTSALQGVFGSHASLAELAGDVPSPRPGRSTIAAAAVATSSSRLNQSSSFNTQLHPSISSSSTTTNEDSLDLAAANYLLENPRPRTRRPSSSSSFSVGGNKPNGTSFDKSQQNGGRPGSSGSDTIFPATYLAADGSVARRSVSAIALRLGALFAIGVAYGQLAKNLHDNQQVSTRIFTLDPTSTSPTLRSLVLFSAIWGLQAVVLGVLLPTVDKKFPQGSIKPATLSTLINAATSAAAASSASPSAPPLRPTSVDSAAAAATAEEEKEQQQEKGGTDWVSVIRGSAAFLGVAYGVRKLPWESSSQVAFLWSCLNPILWFLFDGTRNGFIVSASTAIIETIGFSFFFSSHLPPFDLAGGVYLSVVTWVASVLFCCSICFGNLGRRILSN